MYMYVHTCMSDYHDQIYMLLTKAFLASGNYCLAL